MTDTDTPIDSGNRDFIRSIEKGFMVLRAFSAAQPHFTLAAMARETGLSRAAARRVLITLQTLGYVECHGRQYHLLPQVLDLGYSFVSAGGLTDLIRPHLDALNNEIREACSAGILSDGDVVYVARSQSRRLLAADMGVGARINTASTAIGRVLLSGLDDDAVRAHLADHPPEKYTPKSITDPARVLDEVRRVREQGYAVADQELEIGFHSVAVPLRSADGEYAAAINVGMHESRFTTAEAVSTVVPKMFATAAAIERDLALHPMPF